jgi:phosphoglycolate phosphatase
MSPGFRAVVFDLDGTLADSLGDIGGAMNEALADRGLPVHPMEAYRHFVGEGVEQLAARAAPMLAAPDVARLVVEYRLRYGARIDAETRPYQGITAMLDALTAARFPLAVLSNKREDFTVELVRRLFGRWSFVEVRGERAGVPRKPDPTAALEIVRSLGVAPAECAFVGDTRIDIQTAVAARMLPVGVLWGFRGREELLAAGAKRLLAHPRELLIAPDASET